MSYSQLLNSCKKLIVKRFKPVFIKTKNGWTYSTSTPIDVTLNCANNLHKPRHTLSGIGNIDIDSGCSLHSNAFLSQLTQPKLICSLYP